MSTTKATALEAIQVLQRLSDLFCERREQLARDAGLTVQQWRVLEEINDEHFMPSMFARQRESSPAAVSKIIRQLLDKQVIAVSVSDKDGRQRHYRLTPTGTALMHQLRENRHRAVDAVWGDLDQDALRQFTAFSRKLVGRLEQYTATERIRRAEKEEDDVTSENCIADLSIPALVEDSRGNSGALASMTRAFDASRD